MIHIKKFIDKVSLQEGRRSKDIVLPIEEARGLRDEISKLLADMNDIKSNKKDDIIKVEITGGKFK